MQIPEAVLVLIPVLVGAIGVPVVNWLKSQLGWDGVKALWLSFGVSVVLAVVALLVTGSFALPAGSDPLIIAEKVIEWIGLVFATATLIYKSLSLPARKP